MFGLLFTLRLVSILGLLFMFLFVSMFFLLSIDTMSMAIVTSTTLLTVFLINVLLKKVFYSLESMGAQTIWTVVPGISMLPNITESLDVTAYAVPVTIVIGATFLTVSLINALLKKVSYCSEATGAHPVPASADYSSGTHIPSSLDSSSNSKIIEPVIPVPVTVSEHIVSTHVAEQVASKVVVSSTTLTEPLVSSFMHVSSSFIEPQYALKLWSSVLGDFNVIFNGITVSVLPLFLNVGLFSIVVQQNYGFLFKHLVSNNMIRHPLANFIITTYSRIDTNITEQFLVYKQKIRNMLRQKLPEILNYNQLYSNAINTYSKNIYLNKLTLKTRFLCMEIFHDMAPLPNHYKALYIYQWIQEPTLILFFGLPRLLLLSIIFFFSATVTEILATNPEEPLIYQSLLDFLTSILKRIFE